MARKKRFYRKRASSKSAAKHNLPTGFWSQIGAVLLIAISLLFVVAWFNAGGPVLEWLYQITLQAVGYAVYVVPVLFIYVAIEVFRAEDNRLSLAMKIATVTSIIWFSALFGLLKNQNGATTGGYLGDLINSGVLILVNNGVAAFIYILLVLITLLFIIRVSPFTIIKKLWELMRRDDREQEANLKVMKNAAAIDAPKSGSIGEIKLNAGVPMLDPNDRQSRSSTFRNSVPRDRLAEDQAALVTVSDPNWEAPSLDLLEKKQSPADAGDVQQNAQII
jgi:S-DNA-T family DNA segregation ATPase FtsK/SpoIIIE